MELKLGIYSGPYWPHYLWAHDVRWSHVRLGFMCVFNFKLTQIIVHAGDRYMSKIQIPPIWAPCQKKKIKKMLLSFGICGLYWWINYMYGDNIQIAWDEANNPHSSQLLFSRKLSHVVVDFHHDEGICLNYCLWRFCQSEAKQHHYVGCRKDVSKIISKFLLD